MGFSSHWRWLSLPLCLLYLVSGVKCNCTMNRVEIEGGHFTLTDKMSVGSRLIYHCPEGYYPYPVMSRLCRYTNRWDPPPKTFIRQQCKMIECPDPHVLRYGMVFPVQDRYYVHNETTYECYTGGSLRGSSTRVCQINGKWSGSTPICSIESGGYCADPGIPAGAERIDNMFGISDSVSYICQNNLFLMGSEKRVCQESGHWTGTEPACYYKHTFDTPLEVAEAFGSSIKQNLKSLYSYEISQGERRITLTKNGTLNIYIAVDMSESIEEKEFENAKSAVKELLVKISSFDVNPNYEIMFFSAEVSEIANIIDFFGNNKKPLQSIIDDMDKFTVVERTGTNLYLAFSTIEEKIALIKRITGEKFKEYQHILIFFTDGGYNMGGSPTPALEKIKNHVYMGQTSDQFGSQPRDEYLDIYVFAIGSDIFDDDLKPLTAGTGGDHYFRLKNNEGLVKTFREIIDESEVQDQCGLHNEFAKGDDTIENLQEMYPWLVQISIKNRHCLGSLVTRKFVLTAAHCFRFEDLPKDVFIKIGTTKNSERTVRNFTIHPKFDISARVAQGVLEFYDYDVALIELEDYITISTSIRTICLPCTVETGKTLQFVGDHTCKQQENLILGNKVERLSFLTKGKKVKEKDVHARLDNTRDECISHALQAQGITATDPKIPVTDNFICTGGKQPYIDHIACTGDSGGAVFKNYRHRTIQVALVSWGTQKLCSEGGLQDSTEESRDFHINLFKVVPFLKAILGNDDQDRYAPLKFLPN